MKIVITAPSLNEAENVSGIASLIRSIASHGTAKYVHFGAARKDGESSGAGWILKQAVLPIKFFAMVKRERPDLVHINTAFEPRALIRDLVLAKTANAAGVPVLLHVHGGRFVLRDFESGFISRVAEQLLRTAVKIIVLSDAEARSLLARTQALPLVVLPNAVAVNEIPFRDRKSGEKVLLYYGRFDAEKGLNDILDACKLLISQGFRFRFVSCGAGPERERFAADMRSLLGERFTNKGVLTGTDKWDVLSAADALLLPSRFEGLPLSLLEAMAAGCIPVASDVGAISTVVSDGQNGFLIEPGNITQFVGKLKMLLSESEISLSETRRNARETVSTGFDISDYIPKLESIYRQVAGRK